MGHDRRRFLRLGGLVAAGALAGCGQSEQGGQGGTTGTQTSTATDTGTTTATETGTATETETETETTEEEEGEGQAAYAWMDATWDSYWYSLYNMSANISMSGNGVIFPHNEEQQMAFDQRFPAMLEAADQQRPPVKNANLNMAAFTEADPHFTQKPVLEGPDGRPDASTLTWTSYSGVVSPSSLAWTHLKGVTWAKNFQNHANVLPDELAPLFRAEVLTTLAQLGIMASLVAGGPEENGALTKGDSLELVSEFEPSTGEVKDDTTRPNHHSAMLWFLSDMVSLTSGGWFGYENPEPLIPPKDIQALADGMAETTMNAFSPKDIVEMGSTRDLGQMLGAIGWYGTHAGSSELQSMAADYANALASEVNANLANSGMVRNGAENQAATQGAVGQGLVWASQIEGVDHTSMARPVLRYLVEGLYDEEAGIFVSAPDAGTHTITARDAGDITGGINAADAVVGMSGVKERYTSFFNETFNCGRLQRAQRPPSVDENAECSLPLPPKAGGQFGQAAVYNAAVEYDAGAGEWSVTDDTFDTAQALYLANQDIWISHWGGQFYQGRGVPGESDSPENEAGGTTTTETATETGTETETTGTETTETETETETGTETTDGGSGSSQAVDDWLADTDNYGGSIADETGSGSVEVQVGASGNGGAFAFEPAAIRVSSGTTVTWTWTGNGGAHNVVAESGAFESGAPEAGSSVTFEYTFDESGTFRYECEPHTSLGMKGAVVVE